MSLIFAASDVGKQTDDEKGIHQKEELQEKRGKIGCGSTAAETKHPHPGKSESPGSGCPFSTAQAQHEADVPQISTDKSLPIQERPPPQTQTLEKSLVVSPSQKKSSSTAPALPQTLEKLLVSPAPQEKTLSTIPATAGYSDIPQVSPAPHKKKSPSTVPATVDLRNSIPEREAISKHPTVKAEPADQRTEPPLSE